MINTEKKLYRKVNRKSSYQVRCIETKKVHYRWSRHTKKSKQQAMDGVTKTSMKSGKKVVLQMGMIILHYFIIY